MVPVSPPQHSTWHRFDGSTDEHAGPFICLDSLELGGCELFWSMKSGFGP